MKKMFVSSFYNTLLNKEEAIPTSTMFSIDNMKCQNTFLTIITNRMLSDVLYYNRDYPFVDYVIALNGSIIYDVEKEKCIEKIPLDESIVDEVEKITKNEVVTYYTLDKYYPYRPKDKIYKIEINSSKINKNRLDTLNIKYTTFKYDKCEFLEISGSSPYNSLINLSSKLKLNTNDIMGVVGNLSEKEIIKELDNFYVVSNSPKLLKQETLNRTKSCDAKGVENIINKFFK